MPACKECSAFDPVKNVCINDERWHPRSAVRNCVTEIAKLEIANLPAGGKLLEVGAGVWKWPRIVCHQQQITWYGVDPRWKTDERFRRYHGTASSIPFPDNTFPLVLAFETMEHWHERGDNIPNGLREIHRVLSPGGRLVITVPIHLHGHDMFVQGDVPRILAHFGVEASGIDNFIDRLTCDTPSAPAEGPSWAKVEAVAWRRIHEPVPVHTGWMNNRAWRHFKPLVEAGFKQQTVQKVPSSWSLNINATKG